MADDPKYYDKDYIAPAHIAISNYLRPFDLKVGDRVKHIGRKANGDKQVEYWNVIGIYPHIFMCSNRFGDKTSFTKSEYKTGAVTKVRDEYVE